jgi:hypothetical protein
MRKALRKSDWRFTLQDLHKSIAYTTNSRNVVGSAEALPRTDSTISAGAIGVQMKNRNPPIDVCPDSQRRTVGRITDSDAEHRPDLTR